MNASKVVQELFRTKTTMAGNISSIKMASVHGSLGSDAGARGLLAQPKFTGFFAPKMP